MSINVSIARSLPEGRLSTDDNNDDDMIRLWSTHSLGSSGSSSIVVVILRLGMKEYEVIVVGIYPCFGERRSIRKRNLGGSWGELRALHRRSSVAFVCTRFTTQHLRSPPVGVTHSPIDSLECNDGRRKGNERRGSDHGPLAPGGWTTRHTLPLLLLLLLLLLTKPREDTHTT